MTVDDNQVGRLNSAPQLAKTEATRPKKWHQKLKMGPEVWHSDGNVTRR